MRLSWAVGTCRLLAITCLVVSTSALPKKSAAQNVARPGVPMGHSTQYYDSLSQTFVCQRLQNLADRLVFLFNFVSILECSGGKDRCWEPMRKALYDVEFDLDLFDADLDNSDLSKRFSPNQERQIANCYLYYADRLIEALNILSDRMEAVEEPTSKYLLIAINSLRVADYNAVYELGRRLNEAEHASTIFRKYGALDGSTPDSVREAFRQFAFLPDITGEDFRVLP